VSDFSFDFTATRSRCGRDGGGGAILKKATEGGLGFWDVILCCWVPDISDGHGAFGVLKGHTVQGDCTWVA